MAITRLQVENILIARCGVWMLAAEMNNVASGVNDSLNDPISYALRQMAITPANVVAVVDADLLGVSASDYDKLIDIAEWRLLENILGNFDAVDLSEGPHSERFSQLADRVREKLARSEKRTAQIYGVGVGEMGAGVIDWNFAQVDED